MQQVWTFLTPKFQVDLEISHCEIGSFSTFETDEDESLIRNGFYEHFDAKVSVNHRATGIELGQNTLWGCVYETIEAFRTCSDFYSTVKEAISDARGNLALLQE